MHKSKVEKVNINSNILGKNMPMLVYLPEDSSISKPLPVLYFIHGRTGDENIMYHADLNTNVDKLIKDGKINPMIIVCPRIENSRGVNSSTVCKDVPAPGDSGRVINLGMYEHYFIKEIIPFVDDTFNTINNRAGRYIGGASAGGYSALNYAFRHQNLFTKVGGHMPALELSLDEEDKLYFNDIAIWEENNPISIAENSDIAKDISVYLDAGSNDEGGFYEGCAVLHKILKTKGINSQNHVFPGHHNVEYIQSNTEEYLMFYGS